MSDMSINSGAFSPNEFEDDLGLNTFNNLTEEDEFSDIYEFDHSPGMSSSALIPPSGGRGGYNSMNLNDVHEEVEKLRVEEVRWFYKSGKKKKWKPFVGSDSIRIEKEWRKLSSSEYDADRVCVRGGMHEVDVVEKKCYPVYWPSVNAKGQQEYTELVRGTWFYENNFIPLPEDLANKIEIEHIERWKGLNIKCIKELTGNKVMHCLKMKGCHVDWNSVTDIFLHSDAAQYRALRNIVQRFGVSKATTTGYRLHRGYREDAMYEDCIPPVEHLVFVVHGIGAKPDRHKIVRNTNTFRAACRFAEAKHFIGTTKRIEFLPVEWRSNLKLDGGVVSTITPKRGHGMRQFLNNNAMDVLYYTSPLYRAELVDGLRQEVCKLYKMFTERNTNFNGKISIFAHSLGSVIVHDILTDWQPEALYEKYLMVQLKRNTESLQGLLKSRESSTESLQVELDKFHAAKQYVMEVEEEFLHAQVEKHHASQSSVNPGFPFAVENFFCVGSPLGVFLTLRGYSPKDGIGKQSDIVPTNICKRIFNIFHPSDPVAYRLEPLILPHFTDVMPLQIYNNTAMNKIPYEEIQPKAYTDSNMKEMQDMTIEADGQESDNTSDSDEFTSEIVQYDTITESNTEVEENEALESPPPDTKSPSDEPNSEEKSSYFSAIGKVGRGLWRSRKTSEPQTEETPKIKSDRSNSSSPLPMSSSSRKVKKKSKEEESDLVSSISQDLDHRIDHELIEGFTERNLGYASLTSHTSYWNNIDVALFLLMQIHPNTSMIQNLQN